MQGHSKYVKADWDGAASAYVLFDATNKIPVFYAMHNLFLVKVAGNITNLNTCIIFSVVFVIV